MFTCRLNRFASLIAMMALIFASLAPTISHAFSANNQHTTLLQELCNAHGVKQFISLDIAVEHKQTPSQNPAAMHFEHCPYCGHHVANVGIAPSPTALFLAELNAVQSIAPYAAPWVQSYYPVSHPSHAPPVV